ncbi:S8 family peptidase [Zavarzinia sp.]|uniref:S8 family peptidase n=1 Tax=Zavarzinia sp. TaxID=2027920 RepID=UPI003BB7C817
MPQHLRPATTRCLFLCVSVSLAALLSACGGGGGGGNSGSSGATTTAPATTTTTTPTTPTTTVSALVPTVASVFETTEYKRQAALAMVGASTAWATGASGQGIVVAVNDGQVDTSVSELSGQIASGGYNWIGDSTPDSHATHLAGTIAASHDSTGMEGIAWSASILPLTTFDTDNYSETRAPYDGIIYAADAGADIVNNSWGSSPTDATPSALISAVRHATDRGTVVVFSTGNAGADQPNATVMVPLYDTLTKSMVVAVTAVGTDGTLASYANACGKAAAWCLAAPGTSILATDAGGGYITMTGTSMAAALVSGGLAVVMSRFPELTPAQVVSRLLTTAKDTGIYADTTLYGQGLMNLAAATSPIGTLVTASVGSNVLTDGSATTAGTSLSSNAVLGDSLVRALAGTPVALFDSHDGAAFDVDMASLVTTRGGTKIADLAFGDFGRGHFSEVSGVPGLRLSIGERQGGIGAEAALTSTNVTASSTVAVLRLAFDEATVGFAGLRAGFAEVSPTLDHLPIEAGLALTEGAFTPGALGLADNGAVVGFDSELAGGRHLSLAVMNGAGPDDIYGASDVGTGATGAQASLRQDIGRHLTLEAAVGYVVEDGQMLGATGQGLLSIGGAETAQVSIGATYAFDEKISLYLRYDRAVTSARDTGAFIADAGAIASDSWTVGLLGQDAFAAGDHWGFSAHQPLRASSGHVTIDRPLGRTADGTVYGDKVTLALGGDGREIDWEAYYALPLGDQALLGFNLLYVVDPGNMAAADDEVLGMVRYRRRF